MNGPPRLGAYRYLIDQITEAEIPITTAVVGHRLELGDGALLEVFALGDQGAVYFLTYGNIRFLLPAGADPDLVSDPHLWNAIEPVTGLLLPDGGNASVNPPEWLSKLQPHFVVVSVDSGNLRGLPSQEVLQALEGITILRTDLNGWIEIRSDGESMWVEVERETETKE
jgi:beta-lactamase superfamily II metal-dependent hydrolase